MNSSQAPGDRLQLKEHENVIKSVAHVRQACSDLGDEGGRKPRESLWNMKFDNFPTQHCHVVSFRTRFHVGIIPNEPISRDLHSEVRTVPCRVRRTC